MGFLANTAWFKKIQEGTHHSELGGLVVALLHVDGDDGLGLAGRGPPISGNCLKKKNISFKKTLNQVSVLP